MNSAVTDYLYVLALALMPVFGNFAGGVVAEIIPTTRRMLSRALHIAAGIVVAVVAVKLLPEALAGATVGYWLLRDQSEALKLAALAFTAGLLILASVEEMLGQAHEVAEDSRISAAFFIGGFALFTLVASYFEG